MCSTDKSVLPGGGAGPSWGRGGVVFQGCITLSHRWRAQRWGSVRPGFCETWGQIQDIYVRYRHVQCQITPYFSQSLSTIKPKRLITWTRPCEQARQEFRPAGCQPAKKSKRTPVLNNQVSLVALYYWPKKQQQKKTHKPVNICFCVQCECAQSGFTPTGIYHLQLDSAWV